MSRSTPLEHLFAWMGQADQNALKPEETRYGPIHAALATGEFDRVTLLSNYSRKVSEIYLLWLREHFPDLSITMEVITLTSPMDYHEIHQAVIRVVDEHRTSHPGAKLCFHSSPGTPAMTVVWILLGETRYEARIIRSHYDENLKKNFVVNISFPFSLSAEFIDRVVRKQDDSLLADSEFKKARGANFDSIIHRCDVMNDVIERAVRIAQRNVPVLIEGESGTGKELLARAIHDSSPRKDEPFVALNCGAIPADLFESDLFGHKKGAFTGAIQDRMGAFREAHRGTLFLDEIGELPLAQQVKLLRALQEKKIRPMGADMTEEVDVRIICATHRHLYQDVHEHLFREDLFYRLAVGVITLPPLRERPGDLSLLIEHLLDELHKEHAITPRRRLSTKAHKRLLGHRWPGNVRELRNTLLRAILWSQGETLTDQDIDESIMQPPSSSRDVLDHSLEEGFNINIILDNVKRHYIQRAMTQTERNKTIAARLLGLNSHQTLTSWIEKLDMNEFIGEL